MQKYQENCKYLFPGTSYINLLKYIHPKTRDYASFQVPDFQEQSGKGITNDTFYEKTIKDSTN